MTDHTDTKNYTYMLRCGDGSLYTGWTNDIRHRLKMHREGKGAKYTRGRGPLTLVRLEVYDTKSEAMRREAFIKKLSREEKECLIKDTSWKDRLAETLLSEGDLFQKEMSDIVYDLSTGNDENSVGTDKVSAGSSENDTRMSENPMEKSDN